MKWLFYLPFVAQAVVIMVDEFYFHLRRGLPKWERLGHPLDTLSIAACFLYVLLVAYTPQTLFGFIGIGLFSCLLVTKDEFVHAEECEGAEHWLHALLFVIHPLVLLSMGWMWRQQALFRPFLWVQLFFVAFFCIYQVIYWNFVREYEHEHQ